MSLKNEWILKYVKKPSLVTAGKQCLMSGKPEKGSTTRGLSRRVIIIDDFKE